MVTLSSRKEENRLQAVPPSTGLPTFTSVSKVFDSLQGLQQRLDDFSLDDLSKAIATAKTLGLHLAELQRHLQSLVEIRRSLTVASGVIEQAREEILAQATIEAADRPPRLKEPGSVSNLIQFPHPSRLVLDDVRTVTKSTIETPITNQGANPHITREHSPLIQPMNIPANDANCTASSAFSLFDPGEEPNNESDDTTQGGEESEVNFILGEPPLEKHSNVSQAREDDNSGGLLETAASAEHDSPDRAEPYFLEGYREPASRANDLPTNKTRTSEGGEVKALVPVGPDFDQRLLDDLIKDYGEFASSPNVPATVTPKKDTHNSKNTEDRDAWTISAEESHSATRHLPSIQKEGEINRKLKKLMKDYGEYDLYSRQSPVNLKTGVIGAFLLLGVIFWCFYFFTAPKAVDSSQPSLSIEPAAISTQTGRDLRNSSTSDAVKTFKGTRGTAGGLPETGEISEPNAVINQNPLNKKNGERRLD